jgi:hypothetical protein
MAITFSKGITLTDGISATAGFLPTGGSIYIQGSLGQYVNIPKTIANTSTLLGDHTIEFWYYQTSYNTSADIIWSNSAWFSAGGTTAHANIKSKYLLTAGSSGNMVLSYGITFYSTSTITFTAPSLNNWHHVAITRRNATFFIYVDGIYRGTNATTSPLTGPIGNMTLGSAVSGFNGYISNFRIVNNRQLYSGTSTSSTTPNYQVPTGPLSVPNIATSTAGSTSSQIAITTVAPLSNKAVTYEFWYYNNQTELGGSITIAGVWNSSSSTAGNTTGFYFAIGGSSTWGLGGAGSVGFGGGGSYPSNFWQHVAIVVYPASGIWYVYLDGGRYLGNTFTAGSLTSTRIFLGGNAGVNIAGFRYTVGASLYSDPSIPLPTTAPPVTQAGQPTGIGGSAQFSGANGLTVTGDANTEIGSQDFTWECWVFVPAATVALQTFISQRSGGSGFWFGLNTSGLAPNVWYGTTQIIQSSQSIGTNSWQHVAFTRQAGVTSVFVNGVFGGRTNNATGEPTDQNFGIGQDLDATKGLTGFISNVRVTVGQVLYVQTTITTGLNSFYPMTPANLVPFTAGDNTELLLTMSSSGALLTDSSANNFTVTNVGSVTYSSTNPFVWNTQICLPMSTSGTLLTDTSGSAGNTITGGTWSPIAPWAAETQIVLRAESSANALTDSGPYNLTLVNNGQTSGSFNGTTQYLTLTNNVAFDFGASNTTNFTIETWVHPGTFTLLSSGTAFTILGTYPTSGTQSGYALSYNTSGFLLFTTVVTGTVQTITATNNALTVNAWSHVAVTRSGSTYRLFVNGVQTTTSGSITTNVASTNGNTITVGGLNYTGTTQYMAGFLSNLRVTSGAALYTAGFTPSTSPLTTSPGSGTVILLLPLNVVPFTDTSATAATVTNLGTTTLGSSSPFTAVITAATFNELSPYVSPLPVMNLATAPATATVGTVWEDTSGNGNNGTLAGSNSFLSRVETNGGGIRVLFSAPATYVSTGYSLASTSFTISMIFSLTVGATVPAGLWGNESRTAARGYRAYWDSTARQMQVHIGSASYVFTLSTAVQYTTITEITWVIAPDRITIYQNGVALSAQNAALPGSGFATNTLRFGAFYTADGISASNGMMGTMYNMRVYTEALTAAQVRANFNQYRGNYGI